ncbi:MAG: DNA mismatch repair protein MutS [Alphaproteobacteria bacterium]|nr:DNA mismatch repair protein MutS [Alphaproteobacteria bacterium]
MADSSDRTRANPAPREAASPFLAQYFAAKADYPDAILFFRMGDFYELFFEDAEQAAPALGIALTRRGQHQGKDIPMAGVPWRQADAYLLKLIRAGFRVAVCEQMEDPAEAKKRGSKSIVRRAVTRLVTPGTLTEEGLLDARAANLLAATARDGDSCALAFADVSTGELGVRVVDAGRLEDEIYALKPAEIVCTDGDLASVCAAAALAGAAVTARPAVKADHRAAERRLKALFEVAALDAFGAFGRAELSALGLIVDYVELTQAGAAPRLSPPRQDAAQDFMTIDPATRAALEIDRALRGSRDGSLLGSVDRTVTAAGARLLAERLARPLTDPARIAARLDAIAYLLSDGARRAGVRQALKAAGDIARAQTRLALGRGGPRDLAALRDGLAAGGDAAARSLGVHGDAPVEIEAACAALSSAEQTELAALQRDLERALAVELPLAARDGGFIAAGFDPSLDALRRLRDDSRSVIAGMQSQYADETGTPTLKIKHHGMLGYHVEVSAKAAEAFLQPPLSARFIHRQTNVNAVRFTTTELSELDAKIARAGDAALSREMELFKTFAARAEAVAPQLRAAAAALAVLDVAAGGAEWAEESRAVRPDVDESAALIAEAARHPVVEDALRRTGEGFAANDVRLDGEGQAGARLLLVTGPNMAGKSTYLRQIALLAVLAQAGLYVPAARLRLGIVDRLFARVGASDDLARGRSTFMTEMVETAAILHQAGPRSLVVLDEIGRGTATFDGLAIAWATAEHLHDANRARTVFATHYHELTNLAGRLPACANAHLKVREWKGDLVFLHEVAPGAADRSYGIQVAKLAGAPKSVVDRARAVLARLEATRGARLADAAEAMPLFDHAASAPPERGVADALAERLEAADADTLSPREALDLIYALKAMLKEEKP